MAAAEGNNLAGAGNGFQIGPFIAAGSLFLRIHFVIQITAFGVFVGVTVALCDGKRAPNLNPLGIGFVRFKHDLVHERINAHGIAGQRAAGANAEQGQEKRHEFKAVPTR